MLLPKSYIAVLREFDWQLAGFDPPGNRARQGEIDMLGPQLIDQGLIEERPDGFWATTEKGREYYPLKASS